jgi:hypothetical protein
MPASPVVTSINLNRASLTASIPTGAANTVVATGPGTLVSVAVATAGTGTGNVFLFDNATTNTGALIGIIPATIPAGATVAFNGVDYSKLAGYDYQYGLVVQNVATGPVLIVTYR